MKNKNMDGIFKKAIKTVSNIGGKPDLLWMREEEFADIKLKFAQKNKKVNVVFDIDGCLINYDNTPNYEVIAIFHLLEKCNCNMFAHSGGGKDYCRNWIEKLGLDAIVIEKKKRKEMDVAFDDEDVDLAKVNIKITPNNTLSL